VSLFTANVFANSPSKPKVEYQVYSETAAKLFWSRSTDDPLVVAYEIVRNGHTLATHDALSFFDDNLRTDVQYTYSVTAIDTQGNRSTPATVQLSTGTNSPVFAKECKVVDLGNNVLLAIEGGANVLDPVSVELDDGVYTVVVESADPSHADATQDDQTDERWILEGLNESGKVVFVTPPTNDLAEESISAITNLGSVHARGVVAVRARHAFATSKQANSIFPVRATFINDSCTNNSTDRLCPMVDIGRPRLLGFDNLDTQVSDDIFVEIADGNYEITLVSVDNTHLANSQSPQDNEQ